MFQKMLQKLSPKKRKQFIGTAKVSGAIAFIMTMGVFAFSYFYLGSLGIVAMAIIFLFCFGSFFISLWKLYVRLLKG